MLIGLSPLISPDLLATLHRMGHGDEIVLADANFPGESVGRLTIRADGLRIANLLGAIAPLFPFDEYVKSPLAMMDAAEGDVLDPRVRDSYLAAIRTAHPTVPAPELVERFAFYERARRAFAVVLTGESVAYGNIILKKGVVAPAAADMY